MKNKLILNLTFFCLIGFVEKGGGHLTLQEKQKMRITKDVVFRDLYNKMVVLFAGFAECSSFSSLSRLRLLSMLDFVSDFSRHLLNFQSRLVLK